MKNNRKSYIAELESQMANYLEELGYDAIR